MAPALEKHELRRLRDMALLGKFLTSENFFTLYDDTLLNITTDFDKFEKVGLIVRTGTAKKLKDQRYTVTEAGRQLVAEALKVGQSKFRGSVLEDGLLLPNASPERRILRFLGLRPRSASKDVVSGAGVTAQELARAVTEGLVTCLGREAGEDKGLLLLSEAGARMDEFEIDAAIEAEAD